MDTLRGTFDPDTNAYRDWDASEEDNAAPASRRDLPPEAIGQDERRMQVRAYNHWAGLLGEKMFPSIEDLEPAHQPDFGPFSVLLDFSLGIEDPVVRFLGERLAEECGGNGSIARLSDVPPRSLLSRITDHYMQILANQAPIGFEAEFVNHHGVAVLYRGILLPYSSNDETIDFIYGVINWKEMADQLTADELLLEIDQALELGAELEVEEEVPALRAADPVTEWADSPAHEDEDEDQVLSLEDFTADDYTPEFGDDFDNVAPLDGLGEAASHDDLPMPDFGQYTLEDPEADEYDEDEGEPVNLRYNFASLAAHIDAPAKKAIDLSALPPVAIEPEATFEDEDEDEAVHEAEPEAVAEIEPEVEAEVEIAAEPEVAAEPVQPVFAADDEDEFELVDDLPDDAGLYDCLASARELARNADNTEDRSRSALYAAVSRAYDFALAAAADPEGYAELIADSGLTMQERAPMTPVVKLVFGHDYDKTRLTEYAAVLTHAHRLKLKPGALAGFLAETEGGVKAVVKAERRLRREEQGKPVDDASAVREALAEQLRALEAMTLEALDGAGPEFALVLIRRDEIGCAEILAELPEDIGQIERAARKLFG
ncbi:hypothetical protein [Porphyrobacter sp. LM 6]|uniref:hypothetical protein n=1 Tax=Porphyrobacter sp. LM 6 TaxID=1896196 RepID=UPI000846AF20|nr:hypothetical protein [Porphyrobacter sp. LM 6]AOL93295.1 hypothetical protein BG023_11339 [Porphyrobacter sp. LM 6]